MALPFYWIDSFTERPFAGNPAGVCFVEEWPSDDWMRSLVGEMSLSEIAFLIGGGESWELRWFTPGVEVELCGHATLAAAHAIWESGRSGAEQLTFETRFSGALKAARKDGEVVLDFPANPGAPCPAPDALKEILGPIVDCAEARRDFLVELPSAKAVRDFRPDFGGLERVLESCLIITAPSDDADFDFVSRLFAPRFGVPEDPVTGSAHCMLAPYWAEKLGKERMRAFQASARGGIVGVDVGEKPGRVMLSGKAVTLMEGKVTCES